MFTKLAALMGDRRRHAAPVTPVHSSDNRFGRRSAAVPQRARRQVLLSRWRSSPAGRLECRWEIATTDPSANEPGISVEGGVCMGWRLSACPASARAFGQWHDAERKMNEGPSCPAVGNSGATAGTPMGTMSEGRSAVRRGRGEP
jgi:hypothetical protein